MSECTLESIFNWFYHKSLPETWKLFSSGKTLPETYTVFSSDKRDLEDEASTWSDNNKKKKRVRAREKLESQLLDTICRISNSNLCSDLCLARGGSGKWSRGKLIGHKI